MKAVVQRCLISLALSGTYSFNCLSISGKIVLGAGSKSDQMNHDFKFLQQLLAEAVNTWDFSTTSYHLIMQVPPPHFYVWFKLKYSRTQLDMIHMLRSIVSRINPDCSPYNCYFSCRLATRLSWGSLPVSARLYPSQQH